MDADPHALRQRLEAAGQGHLLDGIEGLSPERRRAYLAQVAAVDLDQIRDLCARRLGKEPEPLDASAIEPLPVTQLPARPAEGADAVRAGRALLEAGQVGVILVAGGQGSRLGYDAPKGCYQCMPRSSKSLFEVHAERILALRRRHGRPVPYYIMTSPATDVDTRAFFDDANYFGLPRDEVAFFEQRTMPAVDLQGRIIRQGPDELFLSPNGHGGVLEALGREGCLEDMASRGTTTIFYHQVDNPLVRVGDPWFLGQHVLAGSEYSLKVIEKNGPHDALGNPCRYKGRPTIIEYSELSKFPKIAERRLTDGRLWLRWGSIAIHAFSVAFLRRMVDERIELPIHGANKKVPFDAAGAKLDPEPTTENGMKFECFVFDALPAARQFLVAETTRRSEYEALKNATGAHSPEAVKQAVSNLCADWLRDAGVHVPLDADGNATAKLEINPLWALDAEELKEKVSPDLEVGDGLCLPDDVEEPSGS